MGRASLALGILMLAVALSMDWFGGAGVGFGRVLPGADRTVLARVAGGLGYAACVAGLLVWMANLGGISTPRFNRVVVPIGVGLNVICMLCCLVLLSGLASYPMQAGFPLFCSAAPLLLLGLADHRAARQRSE